MLPAFETDQNIKNAIFLMVGLSPKARNSVELELYRASADSDGSTDQYILEDAFVNLINDLTTIGLSIDIDYNEFCESLGKLFPFLGLCTVLLPNTLYPLLKTNTHLRDMIGRIITGDLGDDHTYIQILLSEVAGLDGQVPLYPELTDFADQMYNFISQTETFSDYIRNLYYLVSEERMSPETDHERHASYTNKIKDLIGKLSDAVNLFSNDTRYEKMCLIQDKVISDLLSPANYLEYSYLFLESINTLPDELIEGYRRKWYHYYVSHPWCYLYYKIRSRDLHIDGPEWPFITCFAYALSDTKEAFDRMIEDTTRVNPNQSDIMTVSQLY